MTAAELIEELKGCDPNLPVYVTDACREPSGSKGMAEEIVSPVNSEDGKPVEPYTLIIGR